MATSFQVLDGLIAGADPGLQPVLSQIGRITQATHDALDAHAQLNITESGSVQASLDAISRRLAGSERLLAEFGSKFDALDRRLQADEQAIANLGEKLGQHEQRFEDAYVKLNYLNGERAQMEVKIGQLAPSLLSQMAAKYEPVLTDHTSIMAALNTNMSQAEQAYGALRARLDNLESAATAGFSATSSGLEDIVGKLTRRI